MSDPFTPTPLFSHKRSEFVLPAWPSLVKSSPKPWMYGLVPGLGRC